MSLVTRLFLSFSLDLYFTCKHTAITVPAFSGQSYLTIPAPTSTISSSFTLAFSLRTRTPTSLLIYATGTNESFIALELQAGVLVFRYSLGSGAAAVRGNFFPVADGSWHHITLSIQDGVGSLTIDNAAVFTSSTATTVSQHVILLSPLYIGGVGNFSLLHSQLLSHTSGLVGCITDFTLNGSSVNLLERALSGMRISQCVMGRCSSTTCLNGGICIDDTNAPLGYYCRCSLGFAGENCGQGLCLFFNYSVYVVDMSVMIMRMCLKIIIKELGENIMLFLFFFLFSHPSFPHHLPISLALLLFPTTFPLLSSPLLSLNRHQHHSALLHRTILQLPCPTSSLKCPRCFYN